MEILGIGMPELVFIVIIALIVLGPKDMQKAGKTIGKWLRSIVTSDGWKIFQQTSREIRTLPNRLMREANDELNKIGDEINASGPTQTRYNSIKTPLGSQPVPPPPIDAPTLPAENTIAPQPPADSETSKDDQGTNA